MTDMGDMSDIEAVKKQRDEWKYEAKAFRAALQALYNVQDINVARVFIDKVLGSKP